MADDWTPIKPLRYTDAAKAIADRNKIDLEAVKPTGHGYTITYDDVMKAVEAKAKAKETPKAETSK